MYHPRCKLSKVMAGVVLSQRFTVHRPAATVSSHPEPSSPDPGCPPPLSAEAQIIPAAIEARPPPARQGFHTHYQKITGQSLRTPRMLGRYRPGAGRKGAMSVKDELLSKARNLGLCLLGIADPAEFERHPGVQKTSETDEARPRPLEIWPECRSVVVLALHCPQEVFDALVRIDGARSIFSSEIIRHREYRIRDWLRAKGHEARIADEISHKRAALLAGLGHMGRNTLVAHPEYGSDLRFGLVLTDAELPHDAPGDPFEVRLCRDCRRCEEVCPSGAVSDYQVDFSRCVIPTAEGWGHDDDGEMLRARRIQRRGEYLEVECNLCQKVCPLNS